MSDDSVALSLWVDRARGVILGRVMIAPFPFDGTVSSGEFDSGSVTLWCSTGRLTAFMFEGVAGREGLDSDSVTLSSAAGGLMALDRKKFVILG